MSVSFQTDPDPKSQFAPDKFNIIDTELTQKFEEEFKQIDDVIMERLLENEEFKSFFKKVFASKLDKVWDGKNTRMAFVCA